MFTTLWSTGLGPRKPVDQTEHFVEVAVALGRVTGLEIEPEERFGVGRPQVNHQSDIRP